MHDYKLVTRHEELGQLAEHVIRAEYFGLDIETTALKPFDGEVRLVQLNIPGAGLFVVDLFETKGLGPLRLALAETEAVIIGHNLKFESKWFLYHFKVEFKKVFCTYRASALIYNGKDLTHDLYSVYARELGVYPTVKDLGGSDWSGPLSQDQYDYAADDVFYLADLRKALKVKLAKLGLNDVALTEFRVMLPEGAVENKGIFLDSEAWLKVSADNEIKEKKLRASLLKQLPNPSSQMVFPGMDPPFNLDSPVQMLESLKKLGLPVLTTREMDLAKYAKEHPVVADLFEYREASKSLSAFGPGYLAKWIHPRTGRIHSEFFSFTGAGRYANSKPNLQQIPRSKIYRRCFKPAPGKKFIIADYKGIEMVIAAELSGDETLIQVFNDPERDIHRFTAAILNGIKEEEVGGPERQAAKAVNFGFIYGMGPEKLVLYAMMSYKVALTLDQATQFRKRYFDTFPAIKRWHERALRDGKRLGYARTLGGRIRYLEPDAFSEWMNTADQGTGADALKMSLRNVYERLKKYGTRAEITHHVHDEIIVEVDDDPELIPVVKKEVQDGMKESMARLVKRVPIVVECGIGDTWAEK